METSRALFSLRWKILAWFFVNLLVLGGILFSFGRVQFRLGIGSLLAGPTSDRLEGIAGPLANELRAEPVDEWNVSLERATAVWRARGLRVGLFRGDGSYVAGDLRDLPTEVSDLIQQHERRNHGGRIAPPAPPNRGGGPGGGDGNRGDGPPRPPPDRGDGGPPDAFGPMPGPPPDGGPRRGGSARTGGDGRRGRSPC